MAEAESFRFWCTGLRPHSDQGPTRREKLLFRLWQENRDHRASPTSNPSRVCCIHQASGHWLHGQELRGLILPVSSNPPIGTTRKAEPWGKSPSLGALIYTAMTELSLIFK